MIHEIYVERREGFNTECVTLQNELNSLFKDCPIQKIRILNAYKIEGLDENQLQNTISTVFSQPPVDQVYTRLPFNDGNADEHKGWHLIAVELLPGQFNQRSESAKDCIQLITHGKRPELWSGTVYLIKGDITDDQIEIIKKYLINPVESREAHIASCDITPTYPIPDNVRIIEDFDKLSQDGLSSFISEEALAMDVGDMKLVQEYFKKEKRNPTITEIKVIDTYWSDHCRHTTFNTILDNIEFKDKRVEDTFNRYLKEREELGHHSSITLMDMATFGARRLKKRGLLPALDESDEINACTVNFKARFNGQDEDWLLLFKNETHNHPTEIEPFGGAATCIGGAIRDPLSGRSYVYGAMRLSGAGDPRVDIKDTLEGKLPQKKIVQLATKGYSSYGNQIGVATGLVNEVYDSGFVAKRMEVGAVIGAAPKNNVTRKKPVCGDRILLLGGKTGRDGCGGATGSSKSHNIASIDECGAEVQKGNAPEERKLQRLFRNPLASKMIKKCNDFGAGGVSVAIGELADGLSIDLDMVPKKYEGLDGTELAISESQERMAVVIAKDDVDEFIALAMEENLLATPVAEVLDEPVISMKWQGDEIVRLHRNFLDSNGEIKHASAIVDIPYNDITDINSSNQSKLSLKEKLFNDLATLRYCSRRGLIEGFDSTIGAGTVIMPLGGKYQKTPTDQMIHIITKADAVSETCSLMSYGYDPAMCHKDVYAASYIAVIDSVAKLLSAGAGNNTIYLSFQEYFRKLGNDKNAWGLPVAALLGALQAQMDLDIGAIGGKDSMSGTFENLHVPPSLISFAATTDNANNIVTKEFKKVNNKIFMLHTAFDENKGIPSVASFNENCEILRELLENHLIKASSTISYKYLALSLFEMAIGNGLGVNISDMLDSDLLFKPGYGSFILELDAEHNIPQKYLSKLIYVGEIQEKPVITYDGEDISLSELEKVYETTLEEIYPTGYKDKDIEKASIPNIKEYSGNDEVPMHAPYNVKKPIVLIPIFPGTNCEYDSLRAFEDAGGLVQTFVIKNNTPMQIKESISLFSEALRKAHILFLPGGFSGGDEPDGSAKLITSFFRNEAVAAALTDLIENRKGLVGGICNGFQALIKLGLLPHGKILQQDENSITLTDNVIGRHQSKIVNIKALTNKSPWLRYANLDQSYKVAISHGEGRIVGPTADIIKLAETGQIMTQYVDDENNPTMSIDYNPNGSALAIEGLLSCDGRIMGKMGHSERVGEHLYKNIPGEFDMKIFKSAIDYFK